MDNTGPLTFPAIVAVTPVAGFTTTAVYEAAPVPLLFNAAVAASVVLAVMLTVILPVCVPAFMASKAAFTVVYVVGPVVPVVAVTLTCAFPAALKTSRKITENKIE
jgi:hypothetical protein